MLIKVTKTQTAASCPMGIKAKEYLAGETYEIHDSLAKVFIHEGWGKEVSTITVSTPPEVREVTINLSVEDKAPVDEAPADEEEEIAEEKALEETENKAIQKSPENKSLVNNKNNKKGK